MLFCLIFSNVHILSCMCLVHIYIGLYELVIYFLISRHPNLNKILHVFERIIQSCRKLKIGNGLLRVYISIKHDIGTFLIFH